LPSAKPCALSQPDAPLRARTEAAMGAVDRQRVLIAGGVLSDRTPAEAFLVDLTTGSVARTANDLAIARTGASVTAFGARGALVAGGANVVTGEPLQTAEVLVDRHFEDALVNLFEGRTEHGAVTLASGETLLVGGQGARGPLASLEIVDPVTRKKRIGLPPLEHARVRPTVLRLTTGEILVAGGLDAQGTPVGFLEWFSFDVTKHLRTRPLVSSGEEGFVVLPGGGALAVIAGAENNVWLISRLGDLSSAPSIDAAALTEVRLFPGARGSPVLWTGNRWLRWKPWSGEFGGLASVVAAGPTPAFVAPDPGLALWLNGVEEKASGWCRSAEGAASMCCRSAESAAVMCGLRVDLRGPYSTDTALGALLVDGTDFFAPDRLVRSSDATITFEVERGLVLAPTASAFLTDATFASFTLDLDVTTTAPIVVLRQATGPGYGDELEIGGATCPVVVPDGTKALHVTREGGLVRVAFDQADSRPCPIAIPADVRVAVGLRGTGDGLTSAKNFMITRR
jgi:hypothetical protein